MSLGAAIGALTFTGSVIAFLKLDGRMSGKPIMLPHRHLINIALGIVLLMFIVAFSMSGDHVVFWAIALVSFALGVLLIVPIGGADMPVVISMLNSYSGWAAVGIGFTLSKFALIITGSLVGSSGAILVLRHVQGHEPVVHLGDPRRLRRRDRSASARIGQG